MAEHVIFRHDPPDQQPQLTFRGVPSGCAGGANTMAEARASYRTCLSAAARGPSRPAADRRAHRGFGGRHLCAHQSRCGA